MATATVKKNTEKDIAKATLRMYRQSPRKVRLVADAIRGKKVEEALTLLRFADKRAARELAVKHAVPVIPGAEQCDSVESALKTAGVHDYFLFPMGATPKKDSPDPANPVMRPPQAGRVVTFADHAHLARELREGASDGRWAAQAMMEEPVATSEHPVRASLTVAGALYSAT